MAELKTLPAAGPVAGAMVSIKLGDGGQFVASVSRTDDGVETRDDFKTYQAALDWACDQVAKLKEPA